MKCCILRMAEVHALLFQFKFFYSLSISCAKSFLFRNYAFRNSAVTLQACPRSNFPLKHKILHADMSSFSFSDVWQNCLTAEGMKNFIHNVTGLQSSKEIKCKRFLLWISFKCEAPKIVYLPSAMQLSLLFFYSSIIWCGRWHWTHYVWHNRSREETMRWCAT